MFYLGYMFLDDVDYLVVIVSCFIHHDSSLPKRRSALTHLAPCHDHPTLSSIALHLGHPALPLMCTYASYRLAGEQGRTRGVGGDPGVGISGRTRAGRRAAGVPGSPA